MRERGDRAVVGAPAEAFETETGELVQPHPLRRRYRLEQGIAHDAVREPVAQRRAPQLDQITRFDRLGDQVEDRVVEIFDHDP